MSWRASVALRAGTFALDVSIEGDDGVTAIMGPNGSGKTTLLRAIAGALPVQRAEIVVDDRVLVRTAKGIETAVESRGIGYVPQGYGLFPHLGVLENVGFGLSTGPRRLNTADRLAATHAVLERLGAEELADRPVATLSGGEKQRVALARALAIEPSLLLMDEPLAALDVRRRRQVRRFLAEQLSAWGRPSLLVTHDVRDVAALDARLVVLDAGRVLQEGSLAELRASPAGELVAELVAP